MRVVAVGTALALAFAGLPARAEDTFTPEQVNSGRALYARNCSPCHGPRMQDPESAFDLRKFPHDDQARFAASVARGNNQMPPWGDFFKPDQLDALWAYIVAGER